MLEAQRQQITAIENDTTLDDTVRAQAIRAALEHYGALLLQARHTLPEPPNDTALLPTASFNVGRLRAQLHASYGDEWTALVYMRSGDTLLIVTLTPEQIKLDETPYDQELRDTLRRASSSSHQLMIFRDMARRRKPSLRPWDLLHRIADRLVPAAALARLHPNHRLLIVPTEQMHMLPWAGLRIGAGWLAEQAIVQLTPALTVWHMLASRHTAAAPRALLVGCSEFGARDKPLPAVGSELDAIATIWPGAVLRLEDAQATCTALRERSASGELAGDTVVHIATHGQLAQQQALKAHLKLWDDDLWLAEIAALRLNHALVVLSACEGAGADALVGNEVLSLSWALLAAGAGGVLASLWPLGDAAAPPFMERFYTALLAEGDAARALAITQRGLIADHQATNNPLAAPEVWASFVLTGTGGAGH